MKNYYITQQLIYVAVDTEEYHTVEPIGDCIMFRAHVYTNALNHNPRADFLCGIKIKDDVLVMIPTTTPCIVF